MLDVIEPLMHCELGVPHSAHRPRELIECSVPGHAIGQGHSLLEIEVEGHGVLLGVPRNETALSA